MGNPHILSSVGQHGRFDLILCVVYDTALMMMSGLVGGGLSVEVWKNCYLDTVAVISKNI